MACLATLFGARGHAAFYMGSKWWLEGYFPPKVFMSGEGQHLISCLHATQVVRISGLSDVYGSIRPGNYFSYLCLMVDLLCGSQMIT